MLVEILDDELHFQAINDEYETIDNGVIRERTSAVELTSK